MAYQWQPAVLPALRRRAHLKVIINGVDVTNPLKPYLLTVRVLSKMEGPDTCDIELDDRNAELPIPPRRSSVRVEMGWENSPPTLPLVPHVNRIYKMTTGRDLPGYIKNDLPWAGSGFQVVFSGGVITSVESGFSRRGGGRRLWIEAKTGDLTGKMKEPILSSSGTGEVGDLTSAQSFLSDMLGKAGMNVQILGGAQDMMRTFWAADNESPIHAAQRIANESGMAMKVLGNNVFLMPRDSWEGSAMPTVEAVWGVNLIAWRIKPFTGRPEWSGAKSRFFDNWAGLWKKVSGTIGGGGGAPFNVADAVASMAGAAPNEHVGEQFNQANDNDSQDGRGTGYVIINGEPAAAARGFVVIQGARPGVDGRWGIREAEHYWSRGSGYTTRIDIRRPELDANVYEKYKDAWKDIEAQGITLPIPADQFWPPGLPLPPRDL